MARDFLELEPLALQYNECLYLRIFEREAFREYFEGLAIDAHESGCRIMHPFSQDGAQNEPEYVDSDRPQETGVPAVAVVESRPDYHVATGVAQRRHDLQDIARVVLAIAVDSDDVVVPQLERQLVAGLDAAPQAEAMGQGANVG